MWYADELLSNPNFAATLYLNSGKESSAGHKKLASGWVVDSDTAFTVSHNWGDSSNPVTKISDMLASVLNGGVALATSASQGVNYALDQIDKTALKDNEKYQAVKAEIQKITNATSTQYAFVGASSFLKQYTGSDIDLPDLSFNTIFLNDNYEHPLDVGSGDFDALINSILPEKFETVAGLIAKMTAPNGYQLPSDAGSSEEIKGSFLIAIKGLEKSSNTSKSNVTGGLGASKDFDAYNKPKDTSVGLKIISNLLLTKATVTRSSNLVVTNKGLLPAYYQVTMDFTYGKPLLNKDFKAML